MKLTGWTLGSASLQGMARRGIPAAMLKSANHIKDAVDGEGEGEVRSVGGAG